MNEIANTAVSNSFTDIELVSQSGHSVILRAKRNGQWFALKGVASNNRDVPAYSMMLDKEYDILSKIQHPGIVRATEMIRLDSKFAGTYIVMEWIDGQTLGDWLKTPRSLNAKVAVLKQLLSAVGYMHSLGIVHRDLKPENIMISHNGTYLRIIDFGLSDTEYYAILKQPAGTHGYMSQEQRTKGVADVRNDIFSIGGIMKFMDLGLQYRGIMRRCLSPIDKRYSTVDQLAKAVASRKRLHASIGMLIVVIVLLAVISAIWMKESPTKTPKVKPAPVIAQSQKTEADTAVRIIERTAPPQPVAAKEMPAVAEKSAVAETPVPQPVNGSSTNLTSAINAGKAEFDAKAKILDLQFDTITNRAYLKGFQDPYKAWQNFYFGKSKTFGLAEGEYDKLYFALQAYSDNYYKKWYRKFQALNNHGTN